MRTNNVYVEHKEVVIFWHTCRKKQLSSYDIFVILLQLIASLSQKVEQLQPYSQQRVIMCPRANVFRPGYPTCSLCWKFLVFCHVLPTSGRESHGSSVPPPTCSHPLALSQAVTMVTVREETWAFIVLTLESFWPNSQFALLLMNCRFSSFLIPAKWPLVSGHGQMKVLLS